MNDQQLLRYSRQILLPEIDAAGQQRLAASRVLIIGLGGLGSPAAMYLAAAGVGCLHLVDDDRVDLSNLQRQILHDTASIGLHKTASAVARLTALNPLVRLHTHCGRLHGSALAQVVADADLVLDCSDNFTTRFAVNEACFREHRVLISGAAIRWDGQIAVFEGQTGGPCYRCLYAEDGEEDMGCSANGVAAPLVGIIGAMQALEAIKLLCHAGTSLGGRLLLLDGLRLVWRELRLTADPDCPVCQA